MPGFTAKLHSVGRNDKDTVRVTLDIKMGTQRNNDAAVELLMMAGGPVDCIVQNPNRELFEETPSLGDA